MQIDELTRQGCGLIFKEKKTGKTEDWPELVKMLGQRYSGDTVVVWKLDRLGRSLRDLIDLVAEFKSRGVEFISFQAGSSVQPQPLFRSIAPVKEVQNQPAKQLPDQLEPFQANLQKEGKLQAAAGPPAEAYQLGAGCRPQSSRPTQRMPGTGTGTLVGG